MMMMMVLFSQHDLSESEKVVTQKQNKNNVPANFHLSDDLFEYQIIVNCAAIFESDKPPNSGT